MEFKALLLGIDRSGKTSIFRRIQSDAFSESYVVTESFDFFKYGSSEQGYEVTLWDTPGKERFSSLIQAYYRGAHCFTIIVDLTSIESIVRAKNFITELIEYDNSNRDKIILVANKIDVSKEERLVTLDSIRALANKHKIQHILEVSSKNGTGIEALKNKIAQVSTGNQQTQQTQPSQTTKTSKKNESSYSCLGLAVNACLVVLYFIANLLLSLLCLALPFIGWYQLSRNFQYDSNPFNFFYRDGRFGSKFVYDDLEDCFYRPQNNA